MTQPGTAAQPLRVAIIGAGPAGFYAAERLFKEAELVVEVDMFDRLPTPFGLVRNGVAPDHQKIKSVTAAFDRIAGNPRFRFFGNVELGRDVTVNDLKQYYHQLLYTTGAQTDRPLGIPGDDLIGSSDNRCRNLRVQPPGLLIRQRCCLLHFGNRRDELMIQMLSRDLKVIQSP